MWDILGGLELEQEEIQRLLKNFATDSGWIQDPLCSAIASVKQRLIDRNAELEAKIPVFQELINLLYLMESVHVWDREDKMAHDLYHLANGARTFAFFNHIRDIVAAQLRLEFMPVIVSDDLAAVKAHFVEEILRVVLLIDPDMSSEEISFDAIFDFVDGLFPGEPITEKERHRLMQFPMNQTRVWL